MDHKSLIEKAKRLIQADMAANGAWVNAPYKVIHLGELYRVKPMTQDGRTVFHIIRPETDVASFDAAA